MSNFCFRCGLPVPAGVELCHECKANAWLDDVMEGETWNQPPDDSWDAEYDDGDYDQVEDDDESN